MLNVYQVPVEEVQKVQWCGDAVQFDSELHSLGGDHDEFIVINPGVAISALLLNQINEVPINNRCVVWKYQGEWVVKHFTKSWNPSKSYLDIELELELALVWERNPDIDPLMTFKDDPFNLHIDDLKSINDVHYQMIWYMDPDFNPSLDKIWVVRAQLDNYKVSGTKDMGYLSPKVKIEYNPDLPKMDYNITNIPWYDWQYENIWYIDSKFNPTDDKVWVIRSQLDNCVPKQIKDMGHVSPKIDIEYNSELPKLDYIIDDSIPWYELEYEHIWYIDPKFNPTEDKVWAIRSRLDDGLPKKIKNMGYISPKISIEYNPELPDLDYDIDDKIPWYELEYAHVWYIDPKFNPTEDKVWAIKSRLADGSPKRIKNMGYISPKIVYNHELPKLDYTINDDNIPWYDLQYENVWMLDDSLHNSTKEIWAAKITPKKSIGTKVVGNITVNLPKELDVIFISYNEPNAQENWERVLEKCQTAKRVNGISGIVNAHKAAAELATTDMFYVVDGDAYLTDDWDFNFQPKIFDRDCVHVWHSRNPINNLEYGYGGVKLIPKSLMLLADPANTDMTTSISKKFKVMRTVSNLTAFNTDTFSTWRSAFRECCKLAVISNKESLSRLSAWCQLNSDVAYGDNAYCGAIAGKAYGEENALDPIALGKINDFTWLRERYDNSQ